MTPEEKARRAKELRAKQLRAKLAASQAAAQMEAPAAPEVAPVEPAAAPAPTPVSEGPGWWEALGRGTAQGATLGFGDELTGGWSANLADAKRALSGDVGGALRSQWGGLKDLLGMGDGPTLSGLVTGNDGASEWTQRYRARRDQTRTANAAAEREHGDAYLLGNIAGGVLTAPLVPGAGPGRTLWQLMKYGSKVGAGTGAAFGLGSSEADLATGNADAWAQAAGDAAGGAVLGGTAGMLVPPLAAAVGYGIRNVAAPIGRMVRGGFVTPTKEAQRLMSEGADLTLGQMDPGSPFGRVEELAQSAPFVGPSITKAREQGAAAARDAILKAAGAPGAKPPARGVGMEQQLDELRAGYTQIYEDVLDGVKLQPEKYLGSGKWRGLLTDESVRGAARTKGAFEMAANARDIDATPDTRNRALEWLTDQAQSLMPTKSGPNAGTVDARSIQELRSRIRTKIRKLGTGDNDRSLGEIYGRAEEFVSELLEGQLPPEQAARLRATDASYRNLLAVENAANGAAFARQNMEFTPTQLLQTIRSKGATPELKSLVRDAQSVVAAHYPPTGLQQAALSSTPGLRWTGPLQAAVFNFSPAMRQHALKPMWQPGAPQQLLSGLARASEEATVRSPRGLAAASRTLYDLLTPPAPPVSSMAQADGDLPEWATR